MHFKESSLITRDSFQLMRSSEPENQRRNDISNEEQSPTYFCCFEYESNTSFRGRKYRIGVEIEDFIVKVV